MLQLTAWDHRAIELAKAKRVLKWQRDPEGMRIRIIEAAKQEFAAHGLAGARVDRIAANAGANKRMLYYHVGNKEDLYLEVLEGAYQQIRAEERGLDLEHLDPPEAIERLIAPLAKLPLFVRAGVPIPLASAPVGQVQRHDDPVTQVLLHPA